MSIMAIIFVLKYTLTKGQNLTKQIRVHGNISEFQWKNSLEVENSYKRPQVTSPGVCTEANWKKNR